MAAYILLIMIGILQVAHGLIDYVVYPENKRDVSACSQVNAALVKLCGANRVRIYKSQIRQTTEFWVIRALDNQKQILLHLPGVRIESEIPHDDFDSF